MSTSGSSNTHLRTTTGHFPFLDLPAEIRLIIYESLLVCPAQSTVMVFNQRELLSGNSLALWATKYLSSQALNVFRVSRAIYVEAAKVFYSDNTFNFCRTGNDVAPIDACQKFLNSRPQKALGYIKSIEIAVAMRSPLKNQMDESHLRHLVQAVNSNLPALETLTLDLYGDCPDVRRTPWTWPLLSSPPDKWLGALLKLRKVGNLHIKYRRDDFSAFYFGVGASPMPYSYRLGYMVAFLGLVRARLLRNADGMDTRNIRAQYRHAAFFNRDRWKRKVERVCMVECHDDEHGRTLLQPPSRLTPRQVGLREKIYQEGGRDGAGAPEALRRRVRGDLSVIKPYLAVTVSNSPTPPSRDEAIGASDVEDWDMSDDGEADSLDGEDLAHVDTSYVMDEEFLAFYDDLFGRQ